MEAFRPITKSLCLNFFFSYFEQIKSHSALFLVYAKFPPLPLSVPPSKYVSLGYCFYGKFVLVLIPATCSPPCERSSESPAVRHSPVSSGPGPALSSFKPHKRTAASYSEPFGRDSSATSVSETASNSQTVARELDLTVRTGSRT